MTAEQTTNGLPPEWKAYPEGTGEDGRPRWDFAYPPEFDTREEMDFNVYLHPDMSDEEQIAVVELLEAAPRLLAFAQKVAAMSFKHEQSAHFADDCIDTLRALKSQSSELLAKVVGKEAA